MSLAKQRALISRQSALGTQAAIVSTGSGGGDSRCRRVAVCPGAFSCPRLGCSAAIARRFAALSVASLAPSDSLLTLHELVTRRVPPPAAIDLGLALG